MHNISKTVVALSASLIDYVLDVTATADARHRQDLIEVFKMCNGLSRIKLNELFTLDDNIKGTRGHSWKLAKFQCTWDCCIFSPVG